MKRIVTIVFIFFLAAELHAQLDVRAGISSTFKTVNFGGSTVYGNFFYRRPTDFYYGGNNVSLGPVVDLEYRFKRKFWKKDAGSTFKSMAITVHKSLMIGFHFNNHINEERGFSDDRAAGDFRDDVFSRWSNSYLQVPMIYKINIQPFILDEDFHIGFGLGVTHSFLLKSTLEESVIIYERDMDGNRLLDSNGDNIVSLEISDKADVRSFSKTYLVMFTFEISASFKRMYMGMRGWFSLRDQYLTGLEGNWQLNNKQSIYFGSYDKWGKVTYAGGSLVLAYKIGGR